MKGEAWFTVTPSRRHAAGAPCAQEAKVYEPERVPLEHVRVSVWHCWPYGTVEVKLAVTLAPWLMRLPFHEHCAG